VISEARSSVTPAQELRELARDIYALAGARRIASIAWPAVNALIEYLTLQARVMELESERERYRRAGIEPVPLEETTMTQQAKSTIRELRQSIERLNQAQSNPQQLQQLVQEIQQKVQKLESEMDQDR
jgi:DNA repair exonuclease SbcCD ATPase subunit